jgi:hypothetical protein
MELSDAGQQSVARLTAALEGPPWPPEILDDALAVLVLSSATLDALDPIEEAVLAAFAQRIGLSSSPSAQELVQKIGAWFVTHPLPESLAQAMTSALREVFATNSGAAAAALGAAQDAANKVPVEQRAAAQGSTRMGAMGRFALQGPAKNKS